MRAVVYTACFGDHDEPVDLPEIRSFSSTDFCCFTDKPELVQKLPHWRVFVRRPIFKSPRMDAKWYKMSACHLFPGHGWSIYIDASVRVKDLPVMITACYQAMGRSEGGELALFSHPEAQRSLEEEAAFSMTMGKYAGEPCIEQVAHYRSAGMLASDPSYHLYAGGCIVRRHTPWIELFEKRWFDECVHWSVQDQLSLPYVLWQSRRTPGIIPGSIYNNEFLCRVWSGPGR